jgi:hypothetical protein
MAIFREKMMVFADFEHWSLGMPRFCGQTQLDIQPI